MGTKIPDWKPEYQEQINRQLKTAKQHNAQLIGEYTFTPNEDHRKISDTEPQSPIRHESLAEDGGKKKRSGRTVVRFTSYRCRLIKDRTNIEGGIKFIEDSLVYAGLICGDSEAEVSRTVRQVKVKAKEDERTEIEIV